MADKFEWDPEKNEKNIARHKLDFQDITTAFDSSYLEHQDLRKDYGEARWVRLTKFNEIILSIVYTLRGSKIRIISVRRANHYERKIYQKKIIEFEPDKLGISPEDAR